MSLDDDDGDNNVKFSNFLNQDNNQSIIFLPVLQNDINSIYQHDSMGFINIFRPKKLEKIQEDNRYLDALEKQLENRNNELKYVKEELLKNHEKKIYDRLIRLKEIIMEDIIEFEDLIKRKKFPELYYKDLEKLKLENELITMLEKSSKL